MPRKIAAKELGVIVEAFTSRLLKLEESVRRVEDVSRDCAKALDAVAREGASERTRIRQAEHEMWLAGAQTVRHQARKERAEAHAAKVRLGQLEAARKEWDGCEWCLTDPCQCAKYERSAY